MHDGGKFIECRAPRGVVGQILWKNLLAANPLKIVISGELQIDMLTSSSARKVGTYAVG